MPTGDRICPKCKQWSNICRCNEFQTEYLGEFCDDKEYVYVLHSGCPYTGTSINGIYKKLEDAVFAANDLVPAHHLNMKFNIDADTGIHYWSQDFSDEIEEMIKKDDDLPDEEFLGKFPPRLILIEKWEIK
jgi:hypothetical protein